MTRTTALSIGVAGVIAVVAGFVLGNSVFGGSGPESSAESPHRITTSDDSTPIPLPGKVEQLPALDLPPETNAVEENPPESEGTPSSSSGSSGGEEKVEESPQPSSQPDITVAPTE